MSTMTVPNAWPTVRLSDLIRVKHGYAFKGEFFSDSGPYVVLTPGSFFEEGGFRSRGDKEKFYTGEIPDGYVLKKGNLIVAMTEQAEGLLGSAAIVPGDDRYLHNQRLGLVEETTGGRVSTRFLYYLFNTRIVRQQLRATATGLKIRHTSPTRIGEVSVELPPLPVQRKIAAFLSAYDDLIENNLRRIRILVEMSQSLYREWFVEFRFPGHEQARFVDSIHGSIPEGWEVKKFGEIGRLRREKFLESRDLTLPLVDMARLPSKSWALSEFGQSDELSTSRICFEKGDVLFGAIRAYLHKTAVAPLRGVTNVSVHVIYPADKNLAAFLAVQCFRNETIAWADKHSTGTRMPVISWRDFAEMPVTVPAWQQLREFESAVGPMIEVVGCFVRMNQRLRRTRDLLLPRLISGELDTSDLDITVPEEAA
jgi:type I restriction enzyme S subunit